MENMERGSLASFGSGGTTDSEHSRPPVQENAKEQRVSKAVHGRPPPARNPPTAPKEVRAKEADKVVVVAEEEEEEKEEEKLPPAMNALDPAKRLDRLVSFLKL